MAINFAKPAVPETSVEKLHIRNQPPMPEASKPKPKHAGGRPPSGNAKVVLNIRVDADVLAKFKATGPGWQSRINDVLKAATI